jgi:formamidopyrimidine-DNA glycosylase
MWPQRGVTPRHRPKARYHPKESAPLPELPEVETVRRGLAPVLEGAVIAKAQVNRPDLRWPFPARHGRTSDRRARGPPAPPVEIHPRRSVDGRDADHPSRHVGPHDHLGRRDARAAPGVFHHAHPAPEKHDHVVLDTEAGARITFNDARRFGAMDLADGRGEGHWLLKDLGPEPLGNAFTKTTSRSAFRGKRTPVKAALLDQRIVAGLGNIYVCEALTAPISRPCAMPAASPGPASRGLSPTSAMCWPRRSRPGGSSLRDYRQADGDLGYFQHNFASTAARESPAKPPIAAASSAARCSPGGRVSTARCAKDSLNPALAVLTLPP